MQRRRLAARAPYSNGAALGARVRNRFREIRASESPKDAR